MTRTIIFAALALLACTGCEKRDVNEHGYSVFPNNSVFWEYIEYDGHEYVKYMPRLNSLGIAHSPKCPCHNAKGADCYGYILSEKSK